MSKEQTKIRVDIYKLFKELSGQKMTAEVHDKLKQAILAHSEEDRRMLITANKTIENQSKKMKEMAKIIYHKGWDAEILEKHIGFLKEIYEKSN